jgi:hypothetical protein
MEAAYREAQPSVLNRNVVNKVSTISMYKMVDTSITSEWNFYWKLANEHFVSYLILGHGLLTLNSFKPYYVQFIKFKLY